MVEMSRCIEIDAAHRVPDHHSKCRSIHGHRYKIIAYVRGEMIRGGSQKDMVLDFGFLKEAMMNAVHTPCDHALMLYHQDPLLARLNPAKENFEDLVMHFGTRIVKLPVVPTAEGLAGYWHGQIQRHAAHIAKSMVPKGHLETMFVHRVEVWETPNCCATSQGDTLLSFAEVLELKK